MDKQARGFLLADQEELGEKIANIKKKLINMGIIWKNISMAITSKPESVKFANAPDELGSFTMDHLNAPSFDWNEIPKIEAIAQLIQDLRVEQSRLEAVQRKLSQ